MATVYAIAMLVMLQLLVVHAQGWAVDDESMLPVDAGHAAELPETGSDTGLNKGQQVAVVAGACVTIAVVALLLTALIKRGCKFSEKDTTWTEAEPQPWFADAP